MSGSVNRFMTAWAQPSEAETQPNALLRPSPVELAPDAMSARDRVIAWLDAQQKLSEQRGLWTGGQVWEGGHPTVRGLADAAQQLASNFEGGIKGYHGSPHSFERFSSENIGTGEGAQAYGHGLYFAGNEGVAQSYKYAGQPGYQNPAVQRIAQTAYDKVKEGGGDVIAATRNELWSQYQAAKEAADPIAMRQAQDAYNNVTDLVGPNAKIGRMYEVNINANPEHMLDWDKPLSEQSQHVRDRLSGRTDWTTPDMPGARIYSEMVKRTGSPTDAAPHANTAQQLNDWGIPGIRYLDQQSRAAGEGTHNYVVFDDKLIDILRKYGIAGLGIGLGAAATQRNE